jgi:hypothetical protein
MRRELEAYGDAPVIFCGSAPGREQAREGLVGLVKSLWRKGRLRKARVRTSHKDYHINVKGFQSPAGGMKASGDLPYYLLGAYLRKYKSMRANVPWIVGESHRRRRLPAFFPD